MKIGDISKTSGASVRSIRHYEAAGLLKAARSVSGYRDFDATDAALVSRIRQMIALGFTTAEIAVFLPQLLGDPGSDCVAVTRAHRAKLAEIERQIADLEDRSNALRALLSGTNTAVSTRSLLHPDAVSEKTKE